MASLSVEDLLDRIEAGLREGHGCEHEEPPDDGEPIHVAFHAARELAGEVVALRAACAALRECLTGLWEDGWLDGIHVDGCPEDDTCDCPWPVRINAALAADAGRPLLARVAELEAALREIAERGDLDPNTPMGGLCDYCNEHAPATDHRRGCIMHTVHRVLKHSAPGGLDLNLLRKLASGEGGHRTGALMRAGLLECRVTESGQAILAGAHLLDTPIGPICSCGRPSRHESGWCGEEHGSGP